jgi:hypothetical protein
MRPFVNKKFILADSFLFGNLLQTSSEIYVFKIAVFDLMVFEYIVREVHFSYCESDGNGSFLREEEKVIILKTSDVMSSSGIRRLFYVEHNENVAAESKNIFSLGK